MVYSHKKYIGSAAWCYWRIFFFVDNLLHERKPAMKSRVTFDFELSHYHICG